jgi:hypothetical protein
MDPFARGHQRDETGTGEHITVGIAELDGASIAVAVHGGQRLRRDVRHPHAGPSGS